MANETSRNENAEAAAAVLSLLEVPAHIRDLWQKIEAYQTKLLSRIDSLEAQLADMRRQLPPTMKRRKDAAEFLGVSKRTVDRMVKEGSIPVVRSGRTVMCDLTNLRPADVHASSKRVVLGE